MSATPLDSASGERRFWPHFVVPAVLTPIVWMILEGAAQPDGVFGFYVISIGAIPIVFAAVLLPAWRLLRRGAVVGVATAILALPSVAIFFWGLYCALWLAYLLLSFDF